MPILLSRAFQPSHRPLTSLSEANDMIAAATLPTKRQHKLALQQAIRQVEAENAALKEQYLAAQPALQAASAEIAACKALVEKVMTALPVCPAGGPLSLPS